MLEFFGVIFIVFLIVGMLYIQYGFNENRKHVETTTIEKIIDNIPLLPLIIMVIMFIIYTILITFEKIFKK
jgi:hypothetical protein